MVQNNLVVVVTNNSGGAASGQVGVEDLVEQVGYCTGPSGGAGAGGNVPTGDGTLILECIAGQ